MKAVVVREFGPPESIRVEEFPPPRPGENEVLVDVHAAGVNFPDMLVMAGKYQVLPLNNEPVRFPDRRWRRERYELYSGIGPLPETIAPNLRNRGFTVTV